MSNTEKGPHGTQLNEALARFLDGEPEPGDEAVLVEAISNDAEFAAEFNNLLTIDELLRQRVTDSDALVDAILICIDDTEDGEQFVQSVHEKISPARQSDRLRWVLLPLALLAVLAFTWMWPSEPVPDSQIASPDEQQPGFDPDADAADEFETDPLWAAVLRKAIDVDWSDSTKALSVGEVMSARHIKIESGFIELQMDRGAVVRLEGPADLEVLGGMEVSCSSGKLQVDVPPSAHGFVVRTPSVTVIDRGTSFAIDVGTQKGTEVHLIKGMAELVSTSDAERRDLLEGQSVGVSNGVFRDIPPRTEGFPSAEFMSARQRSSIRHARDAWNRRRAAITLDPECLVYFDFGTTKGVETILANLALGADGETDGTIVGCGSVEGRWPNKPALEFKNAFDRLLVPLSGAHRTLSCIASVRLDSIQSVPASLVTMHDDSQGVLRWKIRLDDTSRAHGRLELTRESPQGQSSLENFVSKPFLRPEQLGTWMHLAFVWDSASQVCHQYVNGRLASTHPIRSATRPGSLPQFPDQLIIGNGIFGEARSEATGAHFNGRIDEFALFNRALSAEEIRTYQDLNSVVWKGESGDGRWEERSNWTAGIAPSERDHVVIDTHGEQLARYSSGTSPNFSSLRIGSMRGTAGELDITGGELAAHRNSNAHTRVGVAGGEGLVTQRNGSVELNSLQLGLDSGSFGEYQLAGGDLIIARGIHGGIGSLDVGASQGRGTFLISGGSLATRAGVALGRSDGLGEFTVHGSGASGISIGSHLTHDGFWIQHRGSVLRILIDEHGATPVFIDDIDGNGGGDVTFQAGALLDVDFLAEPQPGSWDVMRWEGKLQDNGLQFASSVDRDRWAFEFVDTDQSGTPDTLRVTATVP